MAIGMLAHGTLLLVAAETATVSRRPHIERRCSE